MDECDVCLLKVIVDFGMGSFEKLYEVIDIFVLIIYYCLNNLKDDGVIENDFYDIDLEVFGFGVIVVVEVLVDYSGLYEEVGNKLLEIEGVM